MSIYRFDTGSISPRVTTQCLLFSHGDIVCIRLLHRSL